MPEAASPRSEASGDSDNDSQRAADHQGKHYAAKDKECQYCHQKFTSSSLGRHLDQYLSKKKPDGIHNVEEIRRLRGTITRRTARSSKKQGSEARDRDRDQEQHPSTGTANTSTRPSPGPYYAHHPQHAPQHFIEMPVEDPNAIPITGVQGTINRMTWHSTGVITDPAFINPSPPSTSTPINPIPAPATGGGGSPPRKRNFSTYASDLATASTSTSPTALADTARALELSLREVLDTLRVAAKHVNTPASPFEFDLPSQTYPALILRLLPTPPSLAHSAPFSTVQTVPISAPGPDQLTPLRNRLTYKIDRWKWNALRLAQRTTSNIADEASFLSNQADSYTTSALQHLNTCFENWMAHPLETRDLLWHVELLRAFQSQKDRVGEMEERLESLEQEASQLKQQVEHLSRCQWPREMALWPPDRLTYGKKVREEISLMNLQRNPASVVKKMAQQPLSLSRARSEVMGQDDATVPPPVGRKGDHIDAEEEDDDGNMVTESVNTRGDKWDFDKLVGKWRSHVKEDRLRRAPWTQYPSEPQPPNGQNASLQLGDGAKNNGVSGGVTFAVENGGVDGSPNNNTSANTTSKDGLSNHTAGVTSGSRKDSSRTIVKGSGMRIVSDW